jgi:hypothetical protein
LKGIVSIRNNAVGIWKVSGTDEFAEWFGGLDEDEQAADRMRGRNNECKEVE